MIITSLRRSAAPLVAALVLGLLTATSSTADEPVDPQPTISGVEAVGSTLTGDPKSWPTGTDLTYAWLAGGKVVPGATKQTLKVSTAQEDRRISFRVTAVLPQETPAEGQDPAPRRVAVTESDPTLFVMRSAKPSIQGTRAVGSTLKAVRPRWTSGITTRYQWLRGGKPIAGQTKSTLRLTRALGSQRIAVRVTGSKKDYRSVARTSDTTLRIMTAATKPRISGDRAVGRTVKAIRGSWTKGARITHQWFADDVALKGATKPTLTVPRSAVNKRLTVRVRATRSGYETVMKTSSSSQRIQLVGRPRLSGSTLATRTLRVSPGKWSTGTKRTYSWYVDGRKISGATGTTLRVSPRWEGKRLSAKVRGTRGGYQTFTTSTGRSSIVRLPARTDPVSLTECPDWAPIKGNADSGIYHVPSGRYYDATHPEECFRTEAAALGAGYRRSKV